jgi:type IV pilus assembly protein PilE
MAPARDDAGLTLLELLVTLALVGILAALAYPSYRSTLLRAHRVEAIDALLGLAAAQERFHLQHGRYASQLDDGTGSSEPELAIPLVTSGGRYRLALPASGAADFTATASVVEGSGQEADQRCSLFSIHANGQRLARDSRGLDTTRRCWG